MQKCSISRCLTLLLTLTFSSVLLAANGAAEVIVVIGSAWTENEAGERFSVLEGQQILASTTLVTENGAIQLAFRDGGFISIQKNTRFRIERFEFNESADGAEWALFELLKGGLRAISGAIGHARAKRYGVRTSYGTIGIRGTAYNILLCKVACVLGNHKTYMQGLHAETMEGTIFIENTAGILDVPAGRSAHVKHAFTLPEFSTFSPNFVLRKAPSTLEESEGDEDNSASDENGESAKSLAIAEPEPDVAPDAASSPASDTSTISNLDTKPRADTVTSGPTAGRRDESGYDPGADARAGRNQWQRHGAYRGPGPAVDNTEHHHGAHRCPLDEEQSGRQWRDESNASPPSPFSQESKNRVDQGDDCGAESERCCARQKLGKGEYRP